MGQLVQQHGDKQENGRDKPQDNLYALCPPRMGHGKVPAGKPEGEKRKNNEPTDMDVDVDPCDPTNSK
jgi:hypothetical protein